jgi:hypothetical protein
MSRTRKAVIAVLFVIVLAGITLFISEKTHRTDVLRIPGRKSSAATTGPTNEEQATRAKTDAESKQQYLDKATAQNQIQTTQPDVVSTTLNLTATQSDNRVTVLTKIHGVSAGSCTLAVANSSKTTEQTVQIIYQPEFSSCAGFSLPVSAVGTGTWNITVKITSDKGDAVQQSTLLEVR